MWPPHSGNFCIDESVLIKGAMLYAQVAMDLQRKIREASKNGGRPAAVFGMAMIGQRLPKLPFNIG